MKKNYAKRGRLAAALTLLGFAGMAQLSGVYTINSNVTTGGTNYQSFSDFANDINSNGVAGSVTVNVVSGTGPYNEQVTFNQVSGTSASKNVIINGNGNLLTWNASSSSPWTLGLNGADHFTFNDLDVTGTDNSYALVCKLSGGADYNRFANCTFACNPNGTATNLCPFSISSTMNSPNSGGSTSGNHNTVTSCTLSNGYYGFVSYGPTSGAYTNHNTIEYSRITDWYRYGIYFNYNEDFTMRNCEIDRITRTSSTTTYPLYGQYTNGSVLDGNKIHKLFDAQPGSTSTMYFYLYYQHIYGGDRNRYVNNIVTDIKHNGTVYFYLYNGGWDILHNTFDWDYPGGNHTGTLYDYFCTTSSTYGETNVYNNLITLRKPGSGTRYGIYIPSSSYLAYTNVDYNNIVTGTGSGGNYFGYLNGAQSSHSGWKSQGVDQNGLNIDPMYTSASDLHPTNVALNDKGTPKGVPFDQKVNGRSGTTPDIGALEFLSVPCTGMPNPGSVVSPTYALCPGEDASLILSSFSSDTGLMYQWSQSTTSSVGPWTVVPTATSVLMQAPPTFTTTWYQVVVTCANSGQSSTQYGTINVAGTTTNTVPYYESFESIPRDNKLPNCSWSADDLGSNALTYTASNTLGRMPRTGTKFASFYYNPSGTRSFYSNGIWLEAGITYSASIWFQTEYYGYANWSDLSILVGPNQNATGQQTVASTGGPAISNVYKSLSNTFQVSASGLYYVAVRATGTTGSSAQYLSWDDLAIEIPCSLNSPTMNVTSNMTTICANDPSGVTLSATGADTYSWSTGDQSDQVTVFPFNPGNNTYFVTGTNTLTNCKQTLSQVVVVNPAPQVNAFANPPVVCAGEPVNLYAFGAQNYLWSNSGTGAIETVSPLTTQTYVVAGYNEHNCSANAIVAVQVNQLPTVNAVVPETACVGDHILLDAEGASSYQFISSGSYSTVDPATAVMTAPGVVSYTIVGTDANGCEGSEDYVIIAEECTGLAEGTNEQFALFPNPARESVTVAFGSEAQRTIEVTDLSGRVLIQTSSEGANAQLDLGGLAAGMYHVIINGENSVHMTKLIRR